MLMSGGGGRGRGGPPRGGGGLRELDLRDQRRVLGVLRMAKFRVTYRYVFITECQLTCRQTDRAFSIMGFGKDAETESFVVEGRDGKPDEKMTVAQYFKTKLNCTVTKPGLPCVRYGKRNLVP
jgi:hypothetical protein